MWIFSSCQVPVSYLVTVIANLNDLSQIVNNREFCQNIHNANFWLTLILLSSGNLKSLQLDLELFDLYLRCICLLLDICDRQLRFMQYMAAALLPLFVNNESTFYIVCVNCYCWWRFRDTTCMLPLAVLSYMPFIWVNQWINYINFTGCNWSFQLYR